MLVQERILAEELPVVVVANIVGLELGLGQAVMRKIEVILIRLNFYNVHHFHI